MELNFGGPVWHASGRGRQERDSWRIADNALKGVGDATLGEWREQGSPGSGVVHVRRRLTEAEATAHGLVVRDIRGSTEGQTRMLRVVAELTDAGLLR